MRLMRLVASLVLLSALAACGSNDDSGDGPRVVASFHPATFVAQRVAGEHVTVTQLTAPGVEAHDLELTAKQVASIHDADVAVYLSGFQSAVDSALDEAEVPHVVDLADGVEPLAADDHDHHDDDHDHGDVDPHVWLDPRNLVPAARAVASELSDIDPDNAADYERNAHELISDLEALDEQFRSGLAHCERRDFVTSHSAFGYLARAYDLHQIPIAGLEPSSEPNTATLATIIDVIEEHDVSTIFTERLASDALAKTVSRETGATVAVLDPIEGLTEETAEEDYLSLMAANLLALREANGCR